MGLKLFMVKRMISVIIIIFNVEDYLHICVNSVLKQTYTDFEIICIDDASTDSSFEILKYFSDKDSRVKVFRNEIHEGIEHCKDKGLELARGDKITFLKADEWFSFDTLEKLSKQTDFIIENVSSNKTFDFWNRLIAQKEVELSNKREKEHVTELSNYKNLIQKLEKDIIKSQKRLGKFTKPQILKKIINKE